MYTNTNTLSAPQLSTSTTQTSPAETGTESNDGMAGAQGNETGVSTDQSVFKKPATPTGKTKVVGRFSIGPVKEVSSSGEDMRTC